MLDSGPIDSNGFRRRCIGTELTFVVFPKKCFITGKLIWLQLAYKQTSLLTGPGDDIFEYRWYNKDEFVIARIKGIV